MWLDDHTLCVVQGNSLGSGSNSRCICTQHVYCIIYYSLLYLHNLLKKLNTLVKTFMLITLGLFHFCMEIVNVFLPCVLSLTKKLTLGNIYYTK
jgi:hypothetical protein